MPPGISLCADGIPASEAFVVAAQHGLVLARIEGALASADSPPDILLLGQVTTERLRQATRSGFFACVEGGGGPESLTPTLLACLAKGGLALSLSTGSAFGLPVARLFAEAVALRIGLPQDQADNLEIVLQEAISNALLHGNLGVDNDLRQSPEDFSLFSSDLDRRLADPALARRRVEVTATWAPDGVDLCIADEGPGFDLSPLEDATLNRITGRGLALIRSLTRSVRVGGRGNRLLLRMDVSPTPHSLPQDDVALPFSECRILVVDDSEANRRLIGSILTSAGIGRLEFAVDGLEALDKVSAFDPDLLLLDIMMPNMDGFAVCRHLRAEAQHADLPILVATALEQPSVRSEVFRAGATDLVTKPLNAAEFLARVRLHLQNRLLILSLREYRARLGTELRLARKMQRALLPSPGRVDCLTKRYGLRIDSHFETSSELGGDCWGLIELDPQRLGIYIVDFSGHGVTAALNTFRIHSLIQNARNGDDPAAFLGSLNEQLADLLPVDQFATMFYGVIDIESDRLTYAAAASTSPIISQPDAAPVLWDAAGLPLGVVKDAAYANREVPFPRGSSLFLYSDGLIEMPSCKNSPLGESGLLDLTARALNIPPPLNTILDYFLEQVCRPLPDDLTAVWLARQEPEAP